MSDKEKELISLCKELAVRLCYAVNELNEAGYLLADIDPLMRPCTACIKQFQCSEVPDTPCDFKWTFTEDARGLVNKAREMCKT